MNDSAVWVRRSDLSVPVVASLPHGADYIPPRFSAGLNRPVEQLRSDWGTRELYDFLPSFNVSVVAAEWSRFVADANRAPDMAKLGRFNEAIVAVTDGSGMPIYHEEPGADEVEQRLREAYEPYHLALNEQVGRLLERHPRVLVLDLHSFGYPLDHDLDIGDGDGATARAKVSEAAHSALSEAGFSVRRNAKFRGGWIVRQFAGNDRVDALQLELNQRTYLRAAEVDQNIWPRYKDPGRFKDTKRRLEGVMGEIIRDYVRLV